MVRKIPMRKNMKTPLRVDVIGLSNALCRDIFGPHADGSMLPDGKANNHGVEIEFQPWNDKIRYFFITTDDVRVTVLFDLRKFAKQKGRYIQKIDLDVQQAINERRGGRQVLLPGAKPENSTLEIIH
jgi:hypothetical protein